MEQNKDQHSEDRENEKVYASMMSDYGFKVTFGNPNNTLFLRIAIQLLIKSKTPIRHISFTRNEASGLTKTSRGGIYDIACEDEKGRVFIVEMQMVDFKMFLERSKFYGFHVFNKMVQKGKYSFVELKDVYVISFLAGKAFNTKSFHHVCNLRNQKGQIIDKQLTFVYLELGKWDKALHQIKNDLDKLIYIMKMTEAIKNKELFQLPHFLSEEWIETAMIQLELGNMTPDERLAYEMEMARVGSIVSAFNEQKKIFNEQKKTIEENEKVIKESKKAIEENETVIKETKKAIEENEKVIKEAKKAVEDKEKVIEDKEKVIEDKEKVIEDKEKVIEDKEKAIQAKNQLIAEQKKQVERSQEELRKEKQLAQQKLEEEKQLVQRREKIFIIKQLIVTNTLNLEQISSVVDLPIEQVKQINEQMK